MKVVARLSFWIPRDRHLAFEAVYLERLVPFLARFELVEVEQIGRPTIEGISTHWFEDISTVALSEKKERLLADPAFQDMMQELGRSFGTSRSDDKLACSFQFHTRPAGAGNSLPAGPGSGHWSSVDCTDGLTDSIVLAIIEDESGHLWFGTGHGGACRYDGETVTVFTADHGLAGNEVRAMLVDHGVIWFGTNGGVSRYDGESFETFTTEDGLSQGGIMSLAQDLHGDLWFISEWEVTRYDGERFSRWPLEGEPRLRVIASDNSGCVWLGTDAGAICISGEDSAVVDAPAGLAGNEVLSICMDGDGNPWFGLDAGVSRYDGTDITSLTVEDGLAAGRVSEIGVDGTGCLWFGTDFGVTHYDGQHCTTFTVQDGLISNGVHTIHADAHGTLWIGTSGGVSRYDPKTVVTFTGQDGLTSNAVYAITEDRHGVLWFGIRQGGIRRFGGPGSASFDSVDGLASDLVRRIYEDRQGNIWISTQDTGVCRFDGTMCTTFTVEDGLAANHVEVIREDSKGNFWMATSAGLCRYDGSEFTTFTTDHGLVHNVITSMLEDGEGNMWFGARHQGLMRYDGQEFRGFDAEDGLAGDGVTAMLLDTDGFLWFGTNGGGVSRYDGQGFTTLTMEDGLASNVVFSMAQDRDGCLWFGTNGGGVSRYDGQTFATYTTGDGLAGNVVWSIIRDRRGAMWIGTNRGATLIQNSPSDPPSVFIDAVIADRRYEGQAKVSIPHRAGSIAIEFHGLSLKTRARAMRYRCRLVGHEDDWHTTQAGRAEYLNLPIGRYTFEVSAVDRDLAYSAVASISLSVDPDPRMEALTDALNQIGDRDEFVGESQQLRQVQSQLTEVARTDVTVLILGETGTGKGLAASAVHMLSDRQGGPFVQVNCGAIPEGLFESEIFGHERGAFTGATGRKLGKVELATGGTLFLDEIGDLAPQVQVKILRLLEEGTFERVGGSRTLALDARVIAATNRNLEQMVEDRIFREDLYFRLHAFPVKLPALRDRREDISLLATYFMDRMAEHLRKNVERIAPDAVAALEAYHWPGNVRELQNVIQRAVIVCNTPMLATSHLALLPVPAVESLNVESMKPDEYEKLFIQRLLKESKGVIRGPAGAAALWGVPESTLRSRMKKLGIPRK